MFIKHIVQDVYIEHHFINFQYSYSFNICQALYNICRRVLAFYQAAIILYIKRVFRVYYD